MTRMQVLFIHVFLDTNSVCLCISIAIANISILLAKWIIVCAIFLIQGKTIYYKNQVEGMWISAGKWIYVCKFTALFKGFPITKHLTSTPMQSFYEFAKFLVFFYTIARFAGTSDFKIQSYVVKIWLGKSASRFMRSEIRWRHHSECTFYSL